MNYSTKYPAKYLDNIDDDLNFGVVEAYKTVRTNLNFAIPKQGPKIIMIASALPAEGKTTTAVNIAITIAQTGSHVLIIDGDLRKPRIHNKFGKINDIGLSNILSGMNTFEEAIRKTGKSNLSIITSGTIPPNPAELLASLTMKELLEKLKEHYEYIIMDSPPINIIADALPVTKWCDGVVLVVKNNISTHPSMTDAMEKLKFAEANILGVVLNGASDSRGYKRNKYRYRYKYGDYNRYYTNPSKHKNEKEND